jgi:hypothetical protein
VSNQAASIAISRRLYEELKAFLDSEGIKPEAWSIARGLLERLRDGDSRIGK